MTKFASFLFLITLFGAYFFISHQEQKTSCPRPLQFNPLFEVSLSQYQNIVDAYIQDLNNDGEADLLFTTQHEKPNQAGSVLIYLSQVSGTPAILKLSGAFEHPRSIQFFDLNNDRYLDLLIADNGAAKDPLEGGQSQVYLNYNGRKFDLLKSFNPRKAFSFNLLPAFQSTQAAYSIVVNQNIPDPGPQSEAFIIDNRLNTKKIHSPWPEALSNQCFKSGITLSTSFVIGGCGHRQTMHPTPFDYEMQWNSQTSKFEIVNKLPKRFQDANWGSVAFAANIDKNFLLLRSTHDNRHNKGAVELLKKEGPTWSSVWGKISHSQLEGFYSNVSFSEQAKYFAISFRDSNKESLTKTVQRQQIFSIKESNNIEEVCLNPDVALNSGHLILFKKKAYLIKNGKQIYSSKLD